MPEDIKKEAVRASKKVRSSWNEDLGVGLFSYMFQNPYVCLCVHLSVSGSQTQGWGMISKHSTTELSP